MEPTSPGPINRPFGDQFSDQYTEATGDLSAGGVAQAGGIVGAINQIRGESDNDAEAKPRESAPQPAATTTSEPARPTAAPSAPTWTPPDDRYRVSAFDRPEPRSFLSIGLPGAIALVGAAIGAWLFVRWRQERNKPVNKLRRRAKALAQDLEHRVPDAGPVLERLQDAGVAAPVGGGGAGLALLTLLIARALRGRSEQQPDLDSLADSLRQAVAAASRTGAESTTQARGRWRRIAESDTAAEASKRATELSKRGKAAVAEARKQAREEAKERRSSGSGKRGPLLGIGAVAATGYLTWRALGR